MITAALAPSEPLPAPPGPAGQLDPMDMGYLILPPEFFPIAIAIGILLGLGCVFLIRVVAAARRNARRSPGPRQVL